MVKTNNIYVYELNGEKMILDVELTAKPIKDDEFWILNSKKFLLHDHHRQRRRTPGESADNACCKKTPSRVINTLNYLSKCIIFVQL